MREIVLDTETTGLSPYDGHRVIEIGCVELFDKIPTGKTFHTYVNPLRDVPKEAFAITGLTEAFLRPFPIFEHVANDFLSFIEDSTLVIHNASFDLKFLDFQLNDLGYKKIDRSRVIDTLRLAREKFPGAPASLDALCKKYRIQVAREKHGALLDAQILARVFYRLSEKEQAILDVEKKEIPKPVSFPRRHFSVSNEELELHNNWLKTFM